MFGIKIGNNFGKQIGKTSKSGLQTFVKTNKKGQKLYTTINNKTKEVVLTKRFTSSQCENSSLLNIDTFDKYGDLISTASRHEKKQGFGPASKNRFSKITRRIFEKFNKFGQTVEQKDTTIRPDHTSPRLTVSNNINGNYSKTYVDTTTFPTKKIKTINCVE